MLVAGASGIVDRTRDTRRGAGGRRERLPRALFEDRTMTHARAEQLERNLLAERSRLEQELERLTTPPTDAAGGHGRFGDDAVESAAGASADVDRAIAVQASRELGDVERALSQLREDPAHFGRCAVCERPISLERLRLVPGTRFCRKHAPT
jgi:RNA polymerase-binding transcription factor DksA